MPPCDADDTTIRAVRRRSPVVALPHEITLIDAAPLCPTGVVRRLSRTGQVVWLVGWFGTISIGEIGISRQIIVARKLLRDASDLISGTS